MGRNPQEALRLSQDELKKLQGELLEILLEFDRICRKLNLAYYLAYGTLLGAIRHQGFIPWDDDVDVWMLRKDYKMFCRLCTNEMDNSKFFFQNAQNDAYYYWTYGKMRLKNTIYIRTGQEHMKQKNGICIDVIPIDNLNKNVFLGNMSKKICIRCRKLLWAHAGKKMAATAGERAKYWLQAKIPKCLLLSIFHFFSCLEKDDQSAELAIYCLEYRTFRRTDFEERIYHPFENYPLPVPEGYENILKQIYNNYMEYPPLEKRIGSASASEIVFSDGTRKKVE